MLVLSTAAGKRARPRRGVSLSVVAITIQTINSTGPRLAAKAVDPRLAYGPHVSIYAAKMRKIAERGSADY
jgi:hypothetical protein